MTNEEKAELICMNIVPPYIDFIHQNYLSAMEIAKWKDEQHAKIIANLLIKIQKLESQVKSLLP